MSDSAPIYIIGMGFVGLACFAGFKALGEDVHGIEKDGRKLSEITSRGGHWIETGVLKILQSIENLNDLVGHKPKPDHMSDKIIGIFCVGTPEGPNGDADLTILEIAISEFLANFSNKTIEIVIKSTVPPGTLKTLTHNFREAKKANSNELIFVSNPEFLREGVAFEDFSDPDRIILGSGSTQALEIERIYMSHFDCVYRTTAETAEFSKYYSNSALATMISYANDMRLFADKIGEIDLAVVFEQFLLDRRWKSGSMSTYFWPGLGFGGYCLPKDTLAISKAMEKVGHTNSIIEAVVNTNNRLIDTFSDEILRRFADKQRIVLLGSSFKVGSEDTRMSKTVELIAKLQQSSMKKIALIDDIAAREIAKTHKKIDLVVESELRDSDGIVVVLRDSSYLNLLQKIKSENVINIPLLY